MQEKELAQKIVAMYYSISDDRQKKEFLKFIRDIVQLLESIDKEDFAQFVDDFKTHLDNIDEIKNNL